MTSTDFWWLSPEEVEQYRYIDLFHQEPYSDEPNTDRAPLSCPMLQSDKRHPLKSVSQWKVEFRNMNVLDVGCHIGYYATLISSFANKVVGIDIDKEVIKKAHKFKNITGATNAEFNVMSAFEVDIDFMKKNDLNAVFIHKTVGDSESNLHWPTEDFHNVFSLFEKHCDIIICNNIIRVKEFFKDKPFSIKESRSFRKNYLYTIKRNNSI